MPRFVNGQVCWIELMTPDVDRAVDFYGKLLGWEHSLDDRDYGMLRLDGQTVAGIQQQLPEQAAAGIPPSWIVYHRADDVVATCEAITANGGVVHVPPTPVGDGSFAVVADPTGAMFALWDGPGFQSMWEVGTFSWAEATSRDPSTARDFYPAVFDGITAVEAPMEDDAPYTMMVGDGDGLFGLMRMDENWPADVPAHWMLYLNVDGTDEACELITASGGHVVVPPMDVPPGRFATVMDPTGAMFSIITMNPDYDALAEMREG